MVLVERSRHIDESEENILHRKHTGKRKCSIAGR